MKIIIPSNFDTVLALFVTADLRHQSYDEQ
jgi:hypothetical protein